jgi:hypothetical protein
MKIRVCFRIKGLAKDEDGNPCDAGMQISLGETDKPYVSLPSIDYETLANSINKEKLLEFICMDGVVSADDLEIITPEEYDKEYDDNDED